MLRSIATLIGLLPIALPALAQTEIDGRTAFYDATTSSYLVSVPDDFDTMNVPDGMDVDFTNLPIIQLTGDFGNDYSNGTITLAQPSGETESYSMKAKYRGGVSNSRGRNKRNFHVKLLDAAGNKLNKSLLGLRKDDSYLLDGGQVDLGRIRNHVAHEIWRDMDDEMYYSNRASDAKNYIDCEFAELFINDEYFGLYSLTEAIDRKQMRLKEYEDDVNIIHGVLYKTQSYEYTTMYGPFSAPDDNSDMWGGFELKYPEIDDVCPTDWSPFYEAVKFVDESGTSDFCSNVGKYFDIPVLVDCFVFHTVLAATDHRGKNLYWACYDTQTAQPMFTLAIWDYDTTWGQTWNNENIHSSSYGPNMGNYLYFANAGGFKLLYRLATENAEDFVNATLRRYRQLRQTVFSEDSLTARYNDYFDMLRASGTLAREEARWSGDTDINGLTLDFDDEQAYIDDYIRRRLTYLDGVFTTESAENAIAQSLNKITYDGANGQSIRYNVNGRGLTSRTKG